MILYLLSETKSNRRVEIEDIWVLEFVKGYCKIYDSFNNMEDLITGDGRTEGMYQ
jgi:hypothetical protein